MKIDILGTGLDARTNTHVVYGQMRISDYLTLVGDDFDSFSIQRRREKHKAYTRLRSDIINGALLPTITLALDPQKVSIMLPDLMSKISLV